MNLDGENEYLTLWVHKIYGNNWKSFIWSLLWRLDQPPWSNNKRLTSMPFAFQVLRHLLCTGHSDVIFLNRQRWKQEELETDYFGRKFIHFIPCVITEKEIGEFHAPPPDLSVFSFTQDIVPINLLCSCHWRPSPAISLAAVVISMYVWICSCSQIFHITVCPVAFTKWRE